MTAWRRDPFSGPPLCALTPAKHCFMPSSSPALTGRVWSGNPLSQSKSYCTFSPELRCLPAHHF